jgi:hypothetical protein
MGMLELERMRWHHAQSECDGKGSLLNYTILEETTLGDAEYVLHSAIGTVQLTPLWPCQLHRRMRRLKPWMLMVLKKCSCPGVGRGKEGE